jgi:hypothetical protein
MKIQIVATLLAIIPMVAYGAAPGPLAVNVTNPVLPVEVSNANPIPIIAPDIEGTRQSFAVVLGVSFDNEDVVCSGSHLVVPADKRIVVEYVSAFLQTTPPATLKYIWLDNIAGGTFRLLVPISNTVALPSGQYFTTAAQSLHFYSDVSLRACMDVTHRVSTSGPVWVSGYFVDKT